MSGMQAFAADGSVREPGKPSGVDAVAVVIPAWQPEERLRQLVSELRLAGIGQVILVDDGSTGERRSLFDDLVRLQGVQLRRHAKNRGKGRALKTAFAYVLQARPELTGVVTADADGQHLPEDIVRVARQLAAQPDRAVLGVRSFAGDVPALNRFGNLLTRWIFALLAGHRVTDTQTGLRGLPVAMLSALGALPGERYEYEMVMLASLCQQENGPVEVPIQTVYLDGNRASHFHPFWDSLRVYGALVRTCVQRWRIGMHGTRKPRLRPA